MIRLEIGSITTALGRCCSIARCMAARCISSPYTVGRAAWIFSGRQPGAHGDQGKEALPWWFFGLLGGLATVWLLTPVLGPWLGLPVGEPGASATGEGPSGLKGSLLSWAVNLALFLPGAVAGGALGWFIIRPVNWALGKFFRAMHGPRARVIGALFGIRGLASEK